MHQLAFRERDLLQLPAICVLTVTVASGVTVPSAGMMISMSPRVAGATATVTGASRGSPAGAACLLR